VFAVQTMYQAAADFAATNLSAPTLADAGNLA